MAQTECRIKSYNKIIRSCWQISKGVVIYSHRGDKTINYLEATTMKGFEFAKQFDTVEGKMIVLTV